MGLFLFNQIYIIKTEHFFFKINNLSFLLFSVSFNFINFYINKILLYIYFLLLSFDIYFLWHTLVQILKCNKIAFIRAKLWIDLSRKNNIKIKIQNFFGKQNVLKIFYSLNNILKNIYVKYSLITKTDYLKFLLIFALNYAMINFYFLLLKSYYFNFFRVFFC